MKVRLPVSLGLLLLASCGGGGGAPETAMVEALFSSLNPPYNSAAEMRARLEGNGVSVLSMECGFADGTIGPGTGRTLYWQATIYASATATALALGPFRVVHPSFVASRAGTFSC